MARRVYVPEAVAPEARELLLAFFRWVQDQPHMVESDDWTAVMMIDAFLLEASGVLEEVERSASGEA